MPNASSTNYFDRENQPDFAYYAAHDGAVIFNLNQRGRIKLTGKDRLDLLNRISTNAVINLEELGVMATVLTSPIGRIIDVLGVWHDGEKCLIITGEGRQQQVLEYLNRNIFFKDDVQVYDVSQPTQLLGVYGIHSRPLMHALVPQTKDMVGHQFMRVDNLMIAYAEQLAGGGYWVFGPSDAVDALSDQLTQKGAMVADRDTYELLCIEGGYPLSENELTDKYIPLEAGLWHAVSFDKGCYTGQEIIARLESRGKLAKMLVRLSIDAEVAIGTKLLDEQKPVGEITSIQQQPNGNYMGMGYVKSPYVSENTRLTSAQGINVKVIGIAGTQPQA